MQFSPRSVFLPIRSKYPPQGTQGTLLLPLRPQIKVKVVPVLN
jgi:hypothetical protein